MCPSVCVLCASKLSQSWNRKSTNPANYSGYFPLHEDPQTRIYRPHPFHKDADIARKRSITLAAELAASSSPDLTLPQSSNSSTMVQTNTPVESYLPSGFHDQPMPMGKYYPSNYEKRHNQQKTHGSRSSLAGNPSQFQSDSNVRTAEGMSSVSVVSAETESRRRMLQYQRDMVAQTTMAMGRAAKPGSKGPSISIGGVPIKEFRHIPAFSHKPKSPTLAPLGSPGPVTPMDLEASGGGYLDIGRGQDRKPGERLAPPGTGFVAYSN